MLETQYSVGTNRMHLQKLHNELCCKMILLNYMPLAHSRLTNHCAFVSYMPYAPSCLSCLCALRAFVPCGPSWLTCLTYLSYLSVFFMRPKIF